MKSDEQPTTPMTANDARGGQKMSSVRTVLGVSIVLVVVAFIAAYFIA
jgi:uncharacterized membrane protein YcfT